MQVEFGHKNIATSYKWLPACLPEQKNCQPSSRDSIFSNNRTFSQQLRYSPILSFLSPFETSFSSIYPHYHDIKANFSVPLTTDQFKST